MQCTVLCGMFFAGNHSSLAGCSLPVCVHDTLWQEVEDGEEALCPLPNVDADVLEKVVGFMKYHVLEEPMRVCPPPHSSVQHPYTSHTPTFVGVDV